MTDVLQTSDLDKIIVSLVNYKVAIAGIIYDQPDNQERALFFKKVNRLETHLKQLRLIVADIPQGGD